MQILCAFRFDIYIHIKHEKGPKSNQLIYNVAIAGFNVKKNYEIEGKFQIHICIRYSK